MAFQILSFLYLSNVTLLLLAYDIHLHAKAFTVSSYYLVLAPVPHEKHNRVTGKQKVDCLLKSRKE